MRRIIPYNQDLIKLARNLRNNSTLAEVLLWKRIKQKQLGYKFQRQKVINNFIVDFYCHELKLVIEIDGSTHGDKIEKDKVRQEKIEKYNIEFLRFLDSEVKRDINGVLASIQMWIKNNKFSP